MTVPPVDHNQEIPANQETPVNTQPRMIQVKLPGSVRTPIATYVLIGVTVLVYLLQMLSQSLLGGDVLAYYGEKINSAILLGEMWRLITPMFLHASILHIGFNMYALYIIGTQLERAYGHKRFLLLYFLTGFAGNTVSFLFSPYASLGASTAIFGLIAAQLIFIFRNRKMFGPRARNMLINLGVIIVLNLALGFAPGIDMWGHLGGLAGGLIFGWMAGPVYQLNASTTSVELRDVHVGRPLVDGSVVTFGVFLAAVIGRMIVG